MDLDKKLDIFFKRAEPRVRVFYLILDPVRPE